MRWLLWSGMLVGAMSSAMPDLPEINAQAAPVTVRAGYPAVLRVGTRGSLPHRVSWFKDGELLEGENLNVLTLPSATLAHSGSYQARFEVDGGASWSRETEVLVLADHENDFVLDPDFLPPVITEGKVRVVRKDRFGRLYLGGDFLFLAGEPVSGIIRLLSNGRLDETFDVSLSGGAQNEPDVREIVLLDDEIILAGRFTVCQDVACGNVIRLNDVGEIVTREDGQPFFGDGANGEVRSIIVDPEGRLLLGGIFSSFEGVGTNQLIRVKQDGSIDNTFQRRSAGQQVRDLLYDESSDTIIVAGDFFGGVSRLDVNGKRVSGFFSEVFELVNEVALQPDRGILVALDSGVGLVRLGTDGIRRLVIKQISHLLPC